MYRNLNIRTKLCYSLENGIYNQYYCDIPNNDIHTLQNKLFPYERWSLEDVEKISNTIGIYVLYDNDLPIGMFCLKPLTNFICYLTSFGIISEYRRKGIGRTLYNYVKELARNYTIDIMFDSHATEDNVTSFYTNIGAKLLYTTVKSHIWIVDTRVFMPRIIAFTGLKGSGKSTAVELIKNNVTKKDIEIHELSFAAPIKRLVSDIFCLTNNECYDPNLKEVILSQWNVTPRELLQKIGTELFRNQLSTVCPNIKMPAETIWVSSLYYNIKNIETENINRGITKSIVLIDDCRFEDEYNTIKKLGGIVIKITRDSVSSNLSSHASEKGCPYDYEINNNWSIDSLESQLANILVEATNTKMN